MQRGRLIVIDGSDGVGKATQTELLVRRLRREGRRVAHFDFPGYDRNFFGALIRECLAGAHGDFVKVDPYIASVLYAADRFESKGLIERALKTGKIVILDRYVSANQMHQGGKIRDPKKRKAFLQWLDRMEHGVFGIPRPDLIIYLHLPVPLSAALMGKRGARDQHERDPKHLADAQKSALQIIKSAGQWHKVACSNGREILPRGVIHEKIWSIITKKTSYGSR